MLSQTLKSVCEQSAVGFDIIVLDNASEDNTKEVVEDLKKLYPQRNIKFVGADKNLGVEGNTQRAIDLVSKKWMMMFHDDDLMHPNYVEHAMETLNKTPDAIMAACTYNQMEEPDDKNWEIFSGKAYIVDSKNFSALLFSGVEHNFGSTIYRVDLFNDYDFKKEVYGKIADRPILLEFSKRGTTVVLKEPYIRYRVHPGQDTSTNETGPYANEWFELLKSYKRILGDSWFNKYGMIYNSFVHWQLRLGYHWMKSVNSKMKFKDFKKLAAENKVIRTIERPKFVEILCNFNCSILKKFLYKSR